MRKTSPAKTTDLFMKVKLKLFQRKIQEQAIVAPIPCLKNENDSRVGFEGRRKQEYVLKRSFKDVFPSLHVPPATGHS